MSRIVAACNYPLSLAKWAPWAVDRRIVVRLAKWQVTETLRQTFVCKFRKDSLEYGKHRLWRSRLVHIDDEESRSPESVNYGFSPEQSTYRVVTVRKVRRLPYFRLCIETKLSNTFNINGVTPVVNRLSF